jgi:hypothetical protein
VLGWGLDVSGLRHGPMEGSCGHGNESSCCIKGMTFLEYLSDY